MPKIKMTHPDKEKGRMAGLVYKLDDNEALEYFEKGWAVLVKETKVKKDGNRKNTPKI